VFEISEPVIAFGEVEFELALAEFALGVFDGVVFTERAELTEIAQEGDQRFGAHHHAGARGVIELGPAQFRALSLGPFESGLGKLHITLDGAGLHFGGIDFQEEEPVTMGGAVAGADEKEAGVDDMAAEPLKGIAPFLSFSNASIEPFLGNGNIFGGHLNGGWSRRLRAR